MCHYNDCVNGRHTCAPPFGSRLGSHAAYIRHVPHSHAGRLRSFSDIDTCFFDIDCRHFLSLRSVTGLQFTAQGRIRTGRPHSLKMRGLPFASPEQSTAGRIRTVNSLTGFEPVPSSGCGTAARYAVGRNRTSASSPMASVFETGAFPLCHDGLSGPA